MQNTAPDPEADRADLEESYADPDRFRENLLFPDTDVEFFKWKAVDAVGFLLAVLGVFAVIGVLYLLLSIGS